MHFAELEAVKISISICMSVDLCSSCRNRRCWAEEGGYSGGSDDDEESHNRPHKAPPRYEGSQVYANLVVHGDIEFKMDQNSYRMVPLSNCEDYMYRTGALGKAKPVSADNIDQVTWSSLCISNSLVCMELLVNHTHFNLCARKFGMQSELH